MQSCAQDMKIWVKDGFSGLDALGQAALVRDRQVSPLELVDAAIARIEAADPHLNAVAATVFEQARKRARQLAPAGLFAGVPTLLKASTRAAEAKEGSEYADALEAGGLVALGTSRAAELDLLGSCEPAAGPTRNPWQLAHGTGGPAGGAAAAVASGMVPVAHASGSLASICTPASFCGLFGFKPSRGRQRRVGRAPDRVLRHIRSEHCVSRSVRDSAAWLAVTEKTGALGAYPLVGYVGTPGKRRLRIGAYTRTCFGRAPDPEVARCMELTMALCEDLGHHVIECAGPSFPAHDAFEAYFALGAARAAGHIARLCALGRHEECERLESFTRALAVRASLEPAAVGGAALAVFEESQAEADGRFELLDVMLSPAVPFTALPLGRMGPASAPDEVIAAMRDLAGYSAIAAIAGWCAMSVPMGASAAGLPIGMQFCAARGQDKTLLQLAYELEQAVRWADRHP